MFNPAQYNSANYVPGGRIFKIRSGHQFSKTVPEAGIILYRAVFFVD